MRIPDAWWFGTTASALSACGVAPRADWYAWERSGRVPHSGEGAGFAAAHGDDLAQWADLGLRHHAPGLDWSRLEPEQGRPDAAAFEAARGVLQAGRDAGVAMWPRLHELTVPGWFADLGGFADDKARSYWWPRHVARCAEELGDLVAGWFPLWEPTVYAARAQLVATLPPGGSQQVGPFRDLLAALVLAWGEAWRELRGGPPVATALRIARVHHPDVAPNAERRAREADRFLWHTWVRALREGLLDVPGLAVREVPALVGALDVVGVTWGGDLAVDRDGKLAAFPTNAPLARHGQALWPEGLGEALHRVGEDLPGRPIVVSVGVGTDDDELRRRWLHDALVEGVDAHRDGVDVQGWLIRSAVDGYEGLAGFGVRYGLLDRKRSPKDSAWWLADLVRTRELDL
jgi:beta-glucosidase